MALWRAVLKPEARDAWKNAWILAATRRLVDKRVSAHREPVRDQAIIWRLGRAINASLKEDLRQRTEGVG